MSYSWRMKIFIMMLVSIPLYAQLDITHSNAVSRVVKRYKRACTVLEVGGSELACTTIVLQPGAVSLEDKTVLAPKVLTLGFLNTLAQCEHLDVVFVHDLTGMVKAPLASLVGTLTYLGEHVFIVAKTKALEQVLQQSSIIKQVIKRAEERPGLFYSYRPKRYLSYSRFTQRHPSQTMYKIESTFKKKQFIKEDSYPLPWVHGINLVTFIMLNGVSPSRATIKQQFLSFKKRYPNHNDLVLGNVIVQGHMLIPIDCTDSRRRAPSERCINVAVNAFNKPWEDDPREWLNVYYRRLIKS